MTSDYNSVEKAKVNAWAQFKVIISAVFSAYLNEREYDHEEIFLSLKYRVQKLLLQNYTARG